jgi:hypothetical protein
MPAIDPTPRDPYRFAIRLPRPLWIGLVAVALVAALSYYLAAFEHPLPEAKEIQRMEARSVWLDGQPDSVSFQVPQSHWAAILSSLLPARLDNDPAKWKSLGDLSLSLSNGGSFEISIFTIDGRRCAFAAGRTWEERVYYRGGSTAGAQKAMADAFAASHVTK